MCSAEVLVFAEALRRPPGARPSGPAVVCRRLFSLAPAGEASRVAREAETQLRRQAAAKWNFDFDRGEPLPGRYQWVPVAAPSKAAAPPVRELKPQRTPVARGKKSAGAGLAGQHKITDFMTSKKRPLSSEVASSHKLKLRRLSGNRAAKVAEPT